MVEPRRTGDESEYLIAYQVRELRSETERMRADMASAFGRLERKVDDNLETAVELCTKLDDRTTELEGWRRERDKSEVVLHDVVQKRLSVWQIAGIIFGIMFGLGTLLVAVAAVIVTIVLNVHG